MKIVVLLTDLLDAIGGIQAFNRSLVNALERLAEQNGFVVSVLVLNDSGRTAPESADCNFNSTIYRGFDGSRIRFLTAALSEVGVARTVILGHVNFSPIAFGLRARNARLQILLAVYGIDVWNRLPALQRISLRRVDRILSISKSTRDRMAAVNELNGTPVDILPCTLEPFFGQTSPLRLRSELGLPEGKMILTTTRLEASEKYKRIDDVIAALPVLLEKVPDAFYVVVGDGSDRSRLETLARDYSISNKVYFAGRVPDELLPSYYNACDVFVLPSTREGFGIVLLEAMHFSKACVGARAAAIPEVIEDGVTGLLHESESVDDLARCLGEVLLHDDLRHLMGRAGRKRLEQEFSFPDFVQRLTASVINV